MTRTQIQLPDDLYRRAKQFGEEREMSLAEMTRRGLELLLSRYPAAEKARQPWKLPKIDGGQLQVSLEQLHEIAAEEESSGHQRP